MFVLVSDCACVAHTHTHSVPSVDDRLLVSAMKMEVGILGSRPLAKHKIFCR